MSPDLLNVMVLFRFENFNKAKEFRSQNTGILRSAKTIFQNQIY